MGELASWLGATAGGLAVGGALVQRRRSSSGRMVRDRLIPVPVVPAARLPRRSHRRRPRPDAVATFPDVVDLLAVAAASGLPATAALVAVASRAPEPWRTELVACADRAARGQLLVDALGPLALALGDVARPIVAVVRAGQADGDRLAADLSRLALDARDLRRRRAEERARRIPVRLLLPLVACSLPAFAVLSIVPIVAGALDGLRLPSVPP